MTRRSPILVLILSFITFGIYSIYWFVSTKGELVARGADIPTSWLIIVPFANFWYLWKWCEGAEHVTNSAVTSVLAFILILVLGPIGQMVLQAKFNKLN